MTAIKNNPEWIIYRVTIVLLSILLIYIIWSPAYFASQDGPSHLYNAWILTVLGDTGYPLINSCYQIRWGLFPNWAGYLILYPLLHVFSPVISEKILVSLIVLGLPAGIICLERTVNTGSERRAAPWWTLLGFLFTLNHPLFKGFYNHALGMVLFIFITAFFWKNNGRGWTTGRLIILNILLAASYFCHIVSFLLTLALIAILYIASKKTARENLRFISALLPMVLLLVYSLAHYGGELRGRLPDWRYLLMETNLLVRGKMLVGFYYHRQYFIIGGILLGIGIIGTGFSRLIGMKKSGWTIDRQLGLFAASVFLLFIYFIAPDASGGGKYVNMRAALYPLLILIVWLETPRTTVLRALLAGIILALILIHFKQTAVGQNAINRHYKRIVFLAEKIPEESFVSSSRNFREWHQQLRPILHALSYGIIGRDIVSLTNYEARLPYFPVKWKDTPELKWPVYSLSAGGADYRIVPVRKNRELEALFYSEILTEK